MAQADSGRLPGAAGEEGGGWASELLENLQRASDEAIDIFYSAFNISQAPASTHAEGLGWGSVNKEGEGRKQFYFGDPSEYDLSEINGPRSQVCAAPAAVPVLRADGLALFFLETLESFWKNRRRARKARISNALVATLHTPYIQRWCEDVHEPCPCGVCFQRKRSVFLFVGRALC
jgi:hypothetical protein